MIILCILTSRCSSRVFFANGRVGLVDDGRTLGSPQTTMISGAWPPPSRNVCENEITWYRLFINSPAPSVWYVWIVWFPKAAMVPGFGQLRCVIRWTTEQVHTLDKSTFVQSVCMNINLIKQSDLYLGKKQHKQLPEHQTCQQLPSNS